MAVATSPGLVNQAPPPRKTGALIPVGVVDQRIALGRGQAWAAVSSKLFFENLLCTQVRVFHFCRVILRPLELRDVIEDCSKIGRLIRHRLIYLHCFPIKFVRLLEVTTAKVEGSHIIITCREVRVIWIERFLLNCKCPSVKGFGFVMATLGIKQLSTIAQALSNGGMIAAKYALPNLQSSVVIFLGLGVLALS
jgi:hypothetical protein